MQIPEIKLSWYDYILIPYERFKVKLYNLKNFLKNCWIFRKELTNYQGWDFSYDIDMLVKMYEIKVKSFEIGSGYAYIDKELKQIKEIYELLKEIQKLDYMEENFKDKYIQIFQKLKYSYKFWW